MPPRPSAWRKHALDIAFTKTDEAAISRALKDQFPEIVFIDTQYLESPNIPFVNSIDACESMSCTIFVPEPGWKPTIEHLTGRLWAIGNAPRKSFEIHRSWWDFTMPRGAKWAWDPPMLTTGHVGYSYRKWDADARKFKLALWRLLKRFGTNRVSTGYPHLGITADGGEAWNTVYGHDALRWSSGGPTRVIDGGSRPWSGWKFPDLKWYEGLEPSEPPEPPEWWKKEREEQLKAQQKAD